LLSFANFFCTRHGLYIVGNMSILAAKSRLWSKIQEKLANRGEIGPTMILECQIHGTYSEIRNETDFQLRVPEGGCNQLCAAKLDCTHDCEKVCHIIDRDHKLYQCPLPCLKKCVNNHACQAKCFRKCPACPVPMVKTLPCQHVATMPCYKDEKLEMCSVIVEKTLPCGHIDSMPCSKDPGEIICRVIVDKQLPCKHRRDVQCHIDPATLTCKIIVSKNLIPCGHPQDAECRFSPDMIKCQTIVPKKFVKCGHEV
jgi:hypothetical protein